MISYKIKRDSLKQKPYRVKKLVEPNESPLNFDILRPILIDEIRNIVEEMYKE